MPICTANLPSQQPFLFPLKTNSTSTFIPRIVSYYKPSAYLELPLNMDFYLNAPLVAFHSHLSKAEALVNVLHSVDRSAMFTAFT